jgi:hypothetical protein
VILEYSYRGNVQIWRPETNKRRVRVKLVYWTIKSLELVSQRLCVCLMAPQNELIWHLFSYNSIIKPQLINQITLKSCVSLFCCHLSQFDQNFKRCIMGYNILALQCTIYLFTPPGLMLPMRTYHQPPRPRSILCNLT